MKSKVKDFACDQCPKRFTDRSILLAHVKRSHLEIIEQNLREFRYHFEGNIYNLPLRKLNPNIRVRCHMCGKSYRVTSVKTHVETVHSGTKYNFNCDMCGKDFASKSGLKYHLKMYHAIIKRESHIEPFVESMVVINPESQDSHLSQEMSHESKFSHDSQANDVTSERDMSQFQNVTDVTSILIE